MNQRAESRFKLGKRSRAALVHLGISALLAVGVMSLVLGLWYPWPYRELSDGFFLVALVVGVDVVLGPSLTLLVFSPHKSPRQLWLDMTVVVMLQMSALAYGVWSVWLARPVQLVYEYGQFGVVRASEVDLDLLPRIPSGVDPLPWNGPGRVALRPFQNDVERMEATSLAISGAPLASRLDLWRPYADARDDVLKAARPLTELIKARPAEVGRLTAAVKESGLRPADLVTLPLVSGRAVWTVMLDAQSAVPLAFARVDPL